VLGLVVALALRIVAVAEMRYGSCLGRHPGNKAKVKRLWIIFSVLLVSAAPAQRPPVSSPLLDHLFGTWILQGTIAGKQTTHDITAEWVANHQYLRLHEVSREKTRDGMPQYDAFIHIGWEPGKNIYPIIFLDNFWGIDPESIGSAEPKENELLFVWKDEKSAVGFTNDFLYDPKTDSWQWIMDNVVNGTKKPFGRVKLTRVAAGKRLSSKSPD
jgi:hypothetical protein